MDLRIRPTTPGDAPAVAAMLDRCGTETLYRRFFTGTSRLPAHVVRAMVTPPAGIALCAVTTDDIVAVGQVFAGADGPAEVALLVEDRWQRQGVGTALARQLLRAAAEAGRTRLRAVVLPDNPVPSRMLRGLAQAARSAYVDGLVVLDLVLPVEPAQRAG